MTATITPAKRVGETTTQGFARLAVGDVTLFPEAYDCYVGDQRVLLTLSQFRILQLLAQHAGHVLRPDDIVEALRPDGIDLEPLAIKNHMYAIRRKLGAASRQVRTVRGVGYGLTGTIHRQDPIQSPHPASGPATPLSPGGSSRRHTNPPLRRLP